MQIRPTTCPLEDSWTGDSHKHPTVSADYSGSSQEGTLRVDVNKFALSGRSSFNTFKRWEFGAELDQVGAPIVPLFILQLPASLRPLPGAY